jgi:hypothetical protein
MLPTLHAYNTTNPVVFETINIGRILVVDDKS